VTKTEEYACTMGTLEDVWRGRSGVIEVAIMIPKVYRHHDYQPSDLVAKEVCKKILIWSKFNSVNVLPLLGFCLDFSPTVPLISPWMDNGSAIEFVREHPDFPAVKLLLGIASGLHYLHENQIVHGDLCGTDILISRDATPYLTGFNLFRDLMQTLSGKASKFGGRPRWMALEYVKEQFTEPPNNWAFDPTKEGDIWAFGMTILELATRKHPFHRIRMDLSVMWHIHNGVLPSRPQIESVCPGWDGNLWAVCQDCWHAIPAQRPTTLELVNRVRQYQDIEYAGEISEPFGVKKE